MSLRHFAGVLAFCVAVAGIAGFAACSSGDDPVGTPTPETPAATAVIGTPTSVVQEQLIVYESRAGGFTEVWTVDANTGATTQITHDNAVSGHPAWSPDYARIIFSSNREDRRNLYTMKADGSDIQRLTNDPNADHWAPKYSPDGSQVTYVEVTEGDGSYLAIVNVDGNEARRVTGEYRFAEFPVWTRDGKSIYFAAIEVGKNSIDIFSVDPATMEVKTIVQTVSADVCPHFSRDGTRLTYASAAPGDPGNTDLFAREAPFDTHTDIGDDLRLTDDPGFDDYSNPSPDDQSYVFVSRRDGNTELYLMDRDGDNERRLTFTADAEENVPDW